MAYFEYVTSNRSLFDPLLLELKSVLRCRREELLRNHNTRSWVRLPGPAYTGRSGIKHVAFLVHLLVTLQLQIKRRNDLRVFGIIMLGLLIIGGFSIIGKGCWFAQRVEKVAMTEFDPVKLFERYEQFKDTYAALEAKRAGIQGTQTKIEHLESMYADVARTEWSRVDMQQHSQWVTEREGLVLSYNNLAAEYNAAMAKINYRFTNMGDLPKGATTPLPREVAPYVTNW